MLVFFQDDRREIIQSLAVGLELDGNIDFQLISEQTSRFSGADLKALLYNAQLKVIHRIYPSAGSSIEDQLSSHMVRFFY